MGDLLPSGWKIERLGKVCQKTAQIDPRNCPDDPFTYIDVSSVSNETFSIVETRNFIGKDAPSRARKLIRKDDVIFATVRPTLRRISMVPTAFDGQLCSTGFCVLRSDKEQLYPDFLYFYLLTEKIANKVEALQKGATYPAIADSDLFNQVILLPQLPEQRAIARALRAVQAAREARLHEAKLERERKAALMEHLFTHGTRGEATKQTAIGEMPESWRIVSLNEVIVDGPQNGIYKPLELYGEGTPIIRIDDFDNDGSFVNFEFKRVRLAHEETGKYKVREKDIIINRVNSLSHLGKCALISKLTEPTVFESNMMRFHVDELKIIPQFLLRYLVTNDNKDRIRNIAKRAVAQSSINQGDVKSLKVPFPPVSEQQEISEVLNACDARISALDHEARLHDELFRAMLEELMSGRLAAGALVKPEG